MEPARKQEWYDALDVPFLFAVHGASTETSCMEFLRETVDPVGSSQKFLTILEQRPVVIQIVNVYFETSLPKRFQKSNAGFIAHFRHYLESRLDPKRIVQVH